MLRSVGGAAALMLLSTFGAAAHEVALSNFKIVHPWTREPAAGVRDVPVSMTVRNTGTETERILAAASPLAREARIVGAGDTASIEIPPGQSVKLSTSGPHIQLLGLTEPLTGYEMFPIWLTLEIAGRVEVEVMVEENDDAARGGGGPAAEPLQLHDHNHGDHK